MTVDRRYPHPAAAHIAFIGQNQCGAQRGNRSGGALIVVADGGHHCGGLADIDTPAAQQLERQQCAGHRMVAAVDRIADIVHIAGNTCQLAGARIITQRFEQVARHLGGHPRMGVAVVGKPAHPQRLVACFDKHADLFIVTNLFIGEHCRRHPSLICGIRRGYFPARPPAAAAFWFLLYPLSPARASFSAVN